MRIRVSVLKEILNSLPDIHLYPYERVRVPILLIEDSFNFFTKPDSPVADMPLIMTFEKDYEFNEWSLINETIHTPSNLLG